jgi:hypothetical protein
MPKRKVSKVELPQNVDTQKSYVRLPSESAVRMREATTIKCKCGLSAAVHIHAWGGDGKDIDAFFCLECQPKMMTGHRWVSCALLNAVSVEDLMASVAEPSMGIEAQDGVWDLYPLKIWRSRPEIG